MGCYITLWYHIYAFSLLFCKVYLKRENSGSWNSGLEKEQILVHYSAHLQMPWKVTWNFLGLYKKYWAKEVPERGHQGATSPATATPSWRRKKEEEEKKKKSRRRRRRRRIEGPWPSPPPPPPLLWPAWPMAGVGPLGVNISGLARKLS